MSGIAQQQQRKDLSLLLDALKSCSAARNLSRGKALHAAAVESGAAANIFVANSLVAMYAKCGSVADAKKVFDGILSPTAASWNSLMLGYVEAGQGELALRVFSQMPLRPNARTFATAVRACGVSLGAGGDDREMVEKVLELQSRAEESGFDSDIFVATSLVDALGKCRRIGDACRAFRRSPKRDVVIWTSLILGCVDNEENELALEFFAAMVDEGCKPNAWTFVAAIKACSGLAEKESSKLSDGKMMKMETLERGIALQFQAARNRFNDDPFVVSSLIELFAKCGSMIDAKRCFDAMASRDVVSWNVLILGYAENGEEEAAVDVFLEMETLSEPDRRSFLAVFKALSGLAAIEGRRDSGKKLFWLETGMAIHSRAASKSFDKGIFVASSLVDMYAKFGDMEDARRVFDAMDSYDSISWNTLLVGYVENGQELIALELFAEMEELHLRNSGVFITAIKACVSYAAKEQGKEIDGRVVKLESLEKGMAVHSRACKTGVDCSSLHVSSSLVEMYASCGSNDDALQAFQRMKHHDVVSWSTLIACFAENGEYETALELFARMIDAGHSPNAQTYVAALKACAAVVDSTAGGLIHAQVCRSGIENDPVLATSFVDFFSKSGLMNKAQEVFDCVQERDSVIWTALISGYGRQGDTDRVFFLFDAMQEQGRSPNAVTYVTVLTACSHAGLVKRGQSYFEGMTRKHGIRPEMEHYMCMVDMLGRANKLEQALEMVKQMPFRANETVWTTVLAACRKWDNLEIGKAAFQAFVDVGSLMANLWKSQVP